MATGGYTGQLVALDADTPAESSLQAAQAANAQTQAGVAYQSAPAEVAYKQQQATALSIQNQGNQLSLNDAVQYNLAKQRYIAKQLAANAPQGSSASAAPQSPLSVSADGSVSPSTQLGGFSPGVTDAISSIDTSKPGWQDEWSQSMTALANGGDATAKQFIDPPDAARLAQWKQANGAAKATALVSQLAGAPQQPGAHGVTGDPIGQIIQGAGGAPAPTSQLGAPAPQSATPLAAGTPAAQGQQQTGQPNPQVSINPATGQFDPDMLVMSTLNPKGAQEIQSMRAMQMYAQTGDRTFLQRYVPDVYTKLSEADKNTSEAQKNNIEIQARTMGSAANAVLVEAQAIKAKGGNPDQDPTLRAQYNQSVIELAQRGWILPQVAKAELAAPTIDWAQLESMKLKAFAVAEWNKSSGQDAANEARAKAANPEPGQAIAGYDANGSPIFFNPRSNPGAQPTVSGNIPVAAGRNGTEMFGSKQKLWLDLHPGDQDGALQYASGNKQLTATEQNQSALKYATQQQQIAALTPGTPFDFNKAVQTNLQILQAGGIPPTPGAGQQGGSGPLVPPQSGQQAPGGSPYTSHTSQFLPVNANTTAPKGSMQWYRDMVTPAQIQATSKYAGTTAKVGTKEHPAIIVDPNTLKGFPKGTYFIGPSGILRHT